MSKLSLELFYSLKTFSELLMVYDKRYSKA
jgi:hypothetical protein